MAHSTKLEPVLIVPDTHRPYHDQRAWDLMLKVGGNLRPKHIIVIGDLADFYKVSAHEKDPARGESFDREIEDVNHAIDELDALGAKDKKFIEGNHCNRLVRYLRDKAPELYGMVTVPKLFRLKERGWTYTPYKEDVKLGKCYFTHDVGTAGRYATYKALDTYQHSIVTGHTHRMGYVVEGNAVGEHKLSASFGWLGDAAKADYMHRVKVNKDWALGFGIGHFDPASGYIYLAPVPIVNYTCVHNGTLYRG